MDLNDLRCCRSLLFLPGSNRRAAEKARTLAADIIVLDLEDAVKPDDKAAARDAAVEECAKGYGRRPVAIRINSNDSAYFGDDVVAVRKAQVDYVVLAKVETPKQVSEAVSLIGRPVLAMVETPRGVIDAAAIARVSRGLIAGTNDLGAALGVPREDGRQGMIYALQRIVLAARAEGIACFDGVYNRLEADDGLTRECAEGRLYGFDGKSVIHPSQIDAVNRAFGPSEEELDAAQRLVDAATGGAERHGGKMIEAMHVEQARLLIAKGRREIAS